jgi:hypothetical protein
MAAMKRLALVAFAAALFLPATANATVPCRDRIYNDWYKDGKIASTYPVSCYRDALKHVPADARTYSSLADDIRAAEQGAMARLHGRKGVPSQIGKGSKGSAQSVTSTLPDGTKTDHSSTTTTTTPSQSSSSTQTETSVAAPAASSGGGGGIPLPIIILGAVAIFLVAVGAIGAGVRRFRG